MLGGCRQRRSSLRLTGCVLPASHRALHLFFSPPFIRPRFARVHPLPTNPFSNVPLRHQHPGSLLCAAPAPHPLGSPRRLLCTLAPLCHSPPRCMLHAPGVVLNPRQTLPHEGLQGGLLQGLQVCARRRHSSRGSDILQTVLGLLSAQSTGCIVRMCECMNVVHSQGRSNSAIASAIGLGYKRTSWCT